MYKFDLFEASAPVDDSRGKINSTKKISFDSSFVTYPNILEYSIRIQVGYALCNITDDSGTDLILKLLHVFQVFAVKHFMAGKISLNKFIFSEPNGDKVFQFKCLQASCWLFRGC